MDKLVQAILQRTDRILIVDLYLFKCLHDLLFCCNNRGNEILQKYRIRLPKMFLSLYNEIIAARCLLFYFIELRMIHFAVIEQNKTNYFLMKRKELFGQPNVNFLFTKHKKQYDTVFNSFWKRVWICTNINSVIVTRTPIICSVSYKRIEHHKLVLWISFRRSVHGFWFLLAFSANQRQSMQAMF